MTTPSLPTDFLRQPDVEQGLRWIVLVSRVLREQQRGTSRSDAGKDHTTGEEKELDTGELLHRT